MTSLLRGEGSTYPVTKFSPVKSLSYWDGVVNHRLLIPFSYSNNTLDIAIQDGTQDLITNGDDSVDEDGYNTRMVKMMGGSGLVTTLGPNFLKWIRKYIGQRIAGSGSGASYNGLVTIVVNPVMTRVQQALQGPLYSSGPLYSFEAIRFTPEPPESDEYIIGGNEGNNYYSVWVFKTPLTIQYVDGGVSKYVTLMSQFTNVY